jgi:hypothetical protein
VMDETELLRLFRDDLPGPTTDAWARARAAIAAAQSEEEQPGRRPGRGPGRRWRQVVVAAAAVILLAAGTSYGLTAGRSSAGRPAGAANMLTDVHGCPGLAATSGALERVTGTSLVLKAPGGEPVTVTTSVSTTLSRQVAGTVSDVTDGANVVVFGVGSRGGFAARRIIIEALPELSYGPPALHLHRRRPPGHAQKPNSSIPAGRAGGTVADAGTGSFTLIMSGGFHFRVTTSGSTTVYAQAKVTLGQLQAGGFVVAAGRVTAGGALAAATVEQGALMPHIQHGNGIVQNPWLGCSPAAVATASLLAAG